MQTDPMKKKYLIILVAQSVIILLLLMYAFVQKSSADACRERAAMQLDRVLMMRKKYEQLEIDRNKEDSLAKAKDSIR